ncbi:hypothetical protein FE633_28165 [Streptomyces montanus]|uniref:Uncharacterized protein n=1 Tax=Streptomyces montanus TaxID=2580423 RepID=A0A5R9FMZ6_9ACTN|nr:hypothetical protein [Streptomyces montanus]TLS42878.1 hypothetical protein FE633_28165 [Streptomyces montanus]
MRLKLVSVAVLGSLALGATPAIAQTQAQETGPASSKAINTPKIDTWQDIAAGKCYYGDQESCELLIKGLKMSKKTKKCLVNASVAAAIQLVVGRFNKELASKVSKQAVGAGATGCITALVN